MRGSISKNSFDKCTYFCANEAPGLSGSNVAWVSEDIYIDQLELSPYMCYTSVKSSFQTNHGIHQMNRYQGRHATKGKATSNLKETCPEKGAIFLQCCALMRFGEKECFRTDGEHGFDIGYKRLHRENP